MTILQRFCLIALLLALSACSYHVFYPNSRDWQDTPDKSGFTYSDHYLKALDGEVLQLWQIKPIQASKQQAVLYFHGNSQNISYHLEQIAWLLDEGYEIVMAEYRGFGAAGGEISLKNSVNDMALVMQWFNKTYKNQEKWLLGQSLGASLSLLVSGKYPQLAHQYNGIIADSGFASFRKIGQDVFSRYWFTWAIQHPLSWFMPKGYNADAVIKYISPTPLMILHSSDDRVVASYHSDMLYRQAQQPKTLVYYTGPHIQGFQQQSVQQAVLNFMAKNANK